MLEILLAILLPNLLALPLYFVIRNEKRGGAPAETAENEPAGDENRVFEILHRVYRELNKQRSAAYGPWISAALEEKCNDPAVALTAVRFVIRDLQNLPVGDGVEYVKGVQFSFNFDALRAAEAELEKMTGAGE